MIIDCPQQLRPDGWTVLYADFPWQFRVWSRDTGLGRSAEAHYPTLDYDEMRRLPIYDLAARDAFLFAWVTSSGLPDQIDLFRHYGFEYVNVAFDWAKQTANGRWHFGMGFYTRQSAELCLLFKKGKPRRASAAVRQLVVAPVGRHSQKPDVVYERIEQLVEGDGYTELTRSYLELFARQERRGWDCMGLDVPLPGQGKDIREVLSLFPGGTYA